MRRILCILSIILIIFSVNFANAFDFTQSDIATIQKTSQQIQKKNKTKVQINRAIKQLDIQIKREKDERKRNILNEVRKSIVKKSSYTLPEVKIDNKKGTNYTITPIIISDKKPDLPGDNQLRTCELPNTSSAYQTYSQNESSWSQCKVITCEPGFGTEDGLACIPL
jgi:hypothetical protein